MCPVSPTLTPKSSALAHALPDPPTLLTASLVYLTLVVLGDLLVVMIERLQLLTLRSKQDPMGLRGFLPNLHLSCQLLPNIGTFLRLHIQ